MFAPGEITSAPAAASSSGAGSPLLTTTTSAPPGSSAPRQRASGGPLLYATITTEIDSGTVGDAIERPREQSSRGLYGGVAESTPRASVGPATFEALVHSPLTVLG